MDDYEPCSCCTPMQQASMALLDTLFEKGKKKSKPFHGYNPNRHSRKGGLNAKVKQVISSATEVATAILRIDDIMGMREQNGMAG